MSDAWDYDSLDMRGLPREWYEPVPFEAQKRIVSIFPDVRLVWNQSIHAFQCFHREPGCVLPLPGHRFATGWEVLPLDFNKPLDVELVVKYLRRNDDFNRKLREDGYADINELADALIDARTEADKKRLDLMFDDFFGKEGSVRKRGEGQVFVGGGATP